MSFFIGIMENPKNPRYVYEKIKQSTDYQKMQLTFPYMGDPRAVWPPSFRKQYVAPPSFFGGSSGDPFAGYFKEEDLQEQKYSAHTEDTHDTHKGEKEEKGIFGKCTRVDLLEKINKSMQRKQREALENAARKYQPIFAKEFAGLLKKFFGLKREDLIRFDVKDVVVMADIIYKDFYASAKYREAYDVLKKAYGDMADIIPYGSFSGSDSSNDEVYSRSGKDVQDHVRKKIKSFHNKHAEEEKRQGEERKKMAEEGKKWIEEMKKRAEEGERMEGLKKKFVELFCKKFERSFNLDTTELFSYSKEELRDMAMLFNEIENSKSVPFLHNVTYSKVWRDIRSYFGAEYFPHEELWSFLKGINEQKKKREVVEFFR